MDLSIILPVLNESRNVAILLRSLPRILKPLHCSYEVIVVDGGSQDGTVYTVEHNSYPVRLIQQQKKGYGEALRLGFAEAQGRYIVTLDADLSHNPALIPSLWRQRNDFDVVIASRYVPGGDADMPWYRKILSRALNAFLIFMLSLPFRDLSSGFRLYRASFVKSLKLNSANFEILEEILIEAFAQGYAITEVPLRFKPRKKGKSKVRLFHFAVTFMTTFVKLWRLRNSVMCGDYDERAYHSRIFIQRYWRRKRAEWIQSMSLKKGRILNLDCGSGRLMETLEGVVGVDSSMEKLRYARKFKKPLIQASAAELPFVSQSWDQVIASQVIQFTPEPEVFWDEIMRLLKPGGQLILGTTDGGSLVWRIIEFFYVRIAPGRYAHPYRHSLTQKEIEGMLQRHKFKILEKRVILGSELIYHCEFQGK